MKKKNIPLAAALLLLLVFVLSLPWFQVRSQTLSDLPLITTPNLSLTDRAYIADVEAAGSTAGINNKDRGATLSQLVTLFGPTIAISGNNISSGTVPNARLDADLAAIADIATTVFGGSLLAAADAAGLRTLAGLGSLATLSTVASSDVTDGTLVNADIASNAAIALSKLATDPLARANHTGTQSVSTITGLGTAATRDTGTTGASIPLWGTSVYGGSSLTWTSELGGTIKIYSQEAFTDDISLLWPLSSGIILTDSSFLNAGNIQFGTLPNAAFPATLPALNGSALTALNASNIDRGTLNSARLPSSGVTAASYTAANITVDSAGRVTAASNGSSGLTIGSTAITGGTSGRILMSGTTLAELTPGSGVAAWLATPTLANFNASTIDADAASLAANTFTGAQTIDANALPLTVRSDGINALIVTTTGTAGSLWVGHPDYFAVEVGNGAIIGKFAGSERSRINFAENVYNVEVKGGGTGNTGLYTTNYNSSAAYLAGDIRLNETVGVFTAEPLRRDAMGAYTGSGHTAIWKGGDGQSSGTGAAGGNAEIRGGAAGGSGDNNGGAVKFFGGPPTGGGAMGAPMRLTEQTPPDPPPANEANVWIQDNGSGKSVLYIQFATGSPQQVSIEP